MQSVRFLRMERFTPKEPLEIVQVLTIILGIIDLGLTADSYQSWVDEQFFLSMVIIVLICSCVGFIGRKTYMTEKTKLIDMLIYLGSGGILTISAIFMFISATAYTEQFSSLGVFERVLAAGLGMCNGVACSYIGIVLMRELQNSIYPIIPKNDYFLLVNWDRISTTNIAGKLQVAVIVLGAVDVGLTAYSYFRYSEEALFLAIITICFVFSFMELLGNLLGFIKTDDFSSYAQALSAFHALGGLVLISGGSLMIVAVTTKSQFPCDATSGSGCGSVDQRLISGILGLMNGILYGLISYCWYVKSKSAYQETQYDWDYEDLLEPLVTADDNDKESASE